MHSGPMVSLPEFLTPFREEAEAYLSRGTFGDIEFSGGTYQVQMTDLHSNEEVWAFLQFDGKVRVRDRFCSYEEVEEVSACPHLAAAYLRIFSGTETPLHIRFQHSLWNQLCQLFLDEWGDDPKIIAEVGDGSFVLRTPESQEAFIAKGITPQGKEMLQDLFLERREETEETSLKFSNLSQEEITLWRQGRPSHQLRYELSFWNDLAKRLMLLQDKGEKYQISFTYTPKKIPQQIHIQFAEIEIAFTLSEGDLAAIIPTLSTVESPLPVHLSQEDTIQRITYDVDSGEFRVEPKKIPPEKREKLEKKGIPLRSWWYLPNDGFYTSMEHPLLKKSVLKGKEIGQALDDHFALIKSKLTETPIHEKPIEVSYSIHFDPDWNLHVSTCLFKPGDLSQYHSRFFGDWVYLDRKGIYPIEGVVFDTAELVVPSDEVGNFVVQHRLWLNTQEGFTIHITGVETKLTYEMTEEDCLLFTRKAMIEEEPEKTKDFGPWVYIAGQGFFSKVSVNAGVHIRSGVTIKPEQIPLFIRMYLDELQLVPGFFSDKCPVSKMGLHIGVVKEQTVSITPENELYPEYPKGMVKFFEEYSYVEGEGFYHLPPEILMPIRFRQKIDLHKEDLPHFFSYEMDQLREYAISIDSRLESPKKLNLIADTLSLESEGYLLKLRYESERGSTKCSDVWTAISKKERYLFSEAGLVDLEDIRFKWLKEINKQQLDRRNNMLTLSTVELLRLNAFDEIYVLEGKNCLKELTEFRIPEEPNISALKSHLRPYQEMGVKWLWFLYHHNLSGLLCDDMGLGKTHQTMALIAAVMSLQKEKKHFLVVCPTSVIYHWEEKIQEFLPSARVCTFHGSNRSMKDFHEDYDILLTSYGIWRNENALLKEVSFEVAIFDEIQAAKNQKSRIHTSLLNVKARMRIGLTGTPIENRLQELKALFDIILPSFMPTETEFRRFFVLPIEKQGSQERKQLLSRFVKPFLLRRKKEDVLLDLPEKTEEVTHCELSMDQRVLYTDVLHKVRQGIFREIENPSIPIPYIHIFSALSSLKQICNHPAAYLKNPAAYKDYNSGKWNLFVELLSEALESKQKVVIFSQYLAMLDILEMYLQENCIGFSTIRGSTVDRGKQVRRFNQDPTCEVFLGSLQAAGLGIDLTAASVVIHYDRWWNAAKEDQATDRVHRIGQTRGVQVFKLVTKGTFEERIDQMILQKGKLLEEVIGVDDHRFMKHFDRNEIFQLLADVAES
ncbi:MAG: hypothetical protein K940chlam7_00238 [Chlamydiae bacterium]|nr:hypothetical protein [Chlamydiota bacterium]